jgi:integrase
MQALKPKRIKAGAGKPDVWEIRPRIYAKDGSETRPSQIIGDVKEFPTQSDVMKSARWQAVHRNINRSLVAVYFKNLCDRYADEVVPQWRSSQSQKSTIGNLRYLEDQWGQYRIAELLEMKAEIKLWLQGDLPLQRYPKRQASRQTRKLILALFKSLISYAVDKKYAPYNPFLGLALSVTKGGALPVDRSRFFLHPEWFWFIQEDLQTRPMLKMMMWVAMLTAMREEEFMALKWDDVLFDGPEPVIEINRVVEGKVIRDFGKNANSMKPVPLSEPLAAALLVYRENNPGVNGFIFGSPQTGRPLWPDTVREKQLKPTLRRMLAAMDAGELPVGTGFHAFRHTYNALAKKVGNDDELLTQAQMSLLRHGSEFNNRRYGRSAPTVLEHARVLNAAIAELVMEARGRVWKKAADRMAARPSLDILRQNPSFAGLIGGSSKILPQKVDGNWTEN